MKLTKKKIGLIEIGFLVAATAVLSMIGAIWLIAETINHDNIILFVVLGSLYLKVFIILYQTK